MGLEVAHLLREQILSCKAFQHGRVGGRNGNDGQEKTNDKKVTTEEFCSWRIIMEKSLLLMPWKHRKFLSSALV